MKRHVLYIVAGILVMLAAGVSGQVVQDRSHSIEQSGAGAPVVSVSSDGQAVRSERVVTQSSPQRRQTGQSPTTEQRAGTQESGTDWDTILWGRDSQENSQSSLAALRERRQARAPDMIPDRSSPTAQQRQPRDSVSGQVQTDPSTRDRAVNEQGQVQTVRTGAGDVAVQQRAQASGDDAGIIQRVVIAVDGALGEQSVDSRTATRGTDISSRNDAAVRRNGGMTARIGTTASGAHAATDQRISTQTPDDGLTVRSRDEAAGSSAGVSDSIAVNQHGGQAVVDTGTSSGDQPRQDRCYTHTHEHGNGGHHGEFHIGTHTHSHTHC